MTGDQGGTPDLRPEAICRRAKGVYFDFGGVISVSPMRRWETTLHPYCEALGLPRAAAKEAFNLFRNLWDGGEISFAEFYRRAFAHAGAPAPTPAQIDEIWRMDAASWVARLRPDTLALMKALKAAGLRLGILSNMSPDFFARLFVPACGAYRALADVEVISGLERLCKPEPAIYALAAARMGLAPGEILFFDDFPRNVEAARRCGWQAEVYPPYADAADARAQR